MVGRTRIPKNAVYPEWELCSELVVKDYWKQKFFEMSRNKFPKNCYYSSGKLSYWKQKNRFEINLDTDDIQSMVNDSIDFFRVHCFMDMNKHNSNRKNALVLDRWCRCNDITKDNLIDLYVELLIQSEGLDSSYRVKLKRMINQGLLRKTMTVTLEDNLIKDISNLYWNEQTREYYTCVNNKFDPSSQIIVVPIKKKPANKIKLTKFEAQLYKQVNTTSKTH